MTQHVLFNRHNPSEEYLLRCTPALDLLYYSVQPLVNGQPVEDRWNGIAWYTPKCDTPRGFRNVFPERDWGLRTSS